MADLITTIASNFAAAIATGGTKPWLATQNDTAKSYALATGCWAYGLSSNRFRSRAVYGPQGRHNGPTLIAEAGKSSSSTRFVITANHYTPSGLTGTAYWLASNGSTISRQIVGSTRIGTSDIRLSMLDSPVPYSAVGAAKLLPSDAIDHIQSPMRLPAVTIMATHADTQTRAVAQEVTWLSAATNGEPEDEGLADYWEAIGAGGSGSPLYTVIDDQEVLLGTWFATQYAPSPSMRIDDLESAAAALAGEAVTFDVVDLGGYDLAPEPPEEPSMATLYLYGTSDPIDVGDLANWWEDSSHTVQATALPGPLDTVQPVGTLLNVTGELTCAELKIPTSTGIFSAGFVASAFTVNGKVTMSGGSLYGATVNADVELGAAAAFTNIVINGDLHITADGSANSVTVYGTTTVASAVLHDGFTASHFYGDVKLEVGSIKSSTTGALHAHANLTIGGLPANYFTPSNWTLYDTSSITMGGATLYGPEHEAAADRSDVRDGVSNLGVIGTLDLPDPSAVSMGVTYDNGTQTGTAVLSQADVQAALTAQGLTTERAAAIDTIASQTDAAQQQANVQAGLTAQGYTTARAATIPTTGTISTLTAAGVRSELATELGRIDATISSRLSSLGANAPAGWINAAAIASDAIGADAIAAAAVSKIQDGLATSSAVSSLSGDVAAVKTRVETALPNAGPGTDNGLATVADVGEVVASAVATSLESVGLDSTSVTNIKDAATVAGSQATTAAAQATAAAAGVAAIAAGETVVRARTHAGDAIARPDDVQVTVEGGVGGGDIPVQIDGVTRNGVGVDNCIVRAYLASDYEAGNLELRGQGVTGPDGKLVAPLMLNAGSYKVVVWDPQTRTSKTFDLEVAAP